MNEAEFRLLSSRRSRVVVLGLVCGLAGTFGWIAFVAAMGFKGVLSVLPALAFFLVPLIVAERRAAAWAAPCPDCGKNLLERGDFVLKSRTCANCSTRVLQGGRLRRPDVWPRVRSIEQVHFLRIWLWAWPAMFLLTVVIHAWDMTALQHCPQAYFLPGLVGTAVSGWTLLRQRRRRYLPVFVASAASLWFGWGFFWGV